VIDDGQLCCPADKHNIVICSAANSLNVEVLKTNWQVPIQKFRAGLRNVRTGAPTL